MTLSWVSSHVERDRVSGVGVDARESRVVRPEDTLATLRRRAEEALAADGVDRTRLGYNVLVKIKIDELILNDLHKDGVPQSEPVSETMRVEEMHDEGL
jgi:hypothetical protein